MESRKAMCRSDVYGKKYAALGVAVSALSLSLEFITMAKVVGCRQAPFACGFIARLGKSINTGWERDESDEGGQLMACCIKV